MRRCAAKVQLPSECRISHSSQSTYFDAVALPRQPSSPATISVDTEYGGMASGGMASGGMASDAANLDAANLRDQINIATGGRASSLNDGVTVARW